MPRRPNLDPSKRKVKSACKTCKARKVKCDEARPACQRCASTGRKCEGYGIWDTPVQSRISHACTYNERSPIIAQPRWMCAPKSVCTIGDQQCLEWFLSRTVTKLPGTFRSSFWDTLLVQACSSEPAVLHAVLALGSVSKDGALLMTNRSVKDRPILDEDRITTRHYLRSIDSLKAHFSKSDRRSVRVILVTCIAFVCLDFLRGHFEAGRTHLRKGIQVLTESYALQSATENTDDDWIVEIFGRLDLMVNLFRRPSLLDLMPIRCDKTPRIFNVAFHDLKEAWVGLGQLIDDILRLSTRSAASDSIREHHSSSEVHISLSKEKQPVEFGLMQWKLRHNKYLENLYCADERPTPQINNIVVAFYYMAMIMARTALSTGDEMAFDDHTQLFLLLLERMCDQRRIIPPECASLEEAETESTHDFISDMGWIAPLHYTATHCRHRRIRLQAVRLLESSFHREGIWDSVTMACVSRKIVDLEERDFYRNIGDVDDFHLTEPPRAEDLKLPTLPQSYRLTDVEVILSGSPMNEVHLFSSHIEERTHRRSLVSTYSIHSHSWTDSVDYTAKLAV